MKKLNERRDPVRFFEYVLDDFLELKAGMDPRRTKLLKAYLLSQGRKNLALRSVEGFRLNGHLVLIEREECHRLKRVVFFNPDKGSFRIKEIPS